MKRLVRIAPFSNAASLLWLDTLQEWLKTRRLSITQQAAAIPHFPLTSELLEPNHPTSFTVSRWILAKQSDH